MIVALAQHPHEDLRGVEYLFGIPFITEDRCASVVEPFLKSWDHILSSISNKQMQMTAPSNIRVTRDSIVIVVLLLS